MEPGKCQPACRTGGHTVQRQRITGRKPSLGMEGAWGGTARGPWMQAKEKELSGRSGLPVPAWLERKRQRQPVGLGVRVGRSGVRQKGPEELVRRAWRPWTLSRTMAVYSRVRGRKEEEGGASLGTRQCGQSHRVWSGGSGGFPTPFHSFKYPPVTALICSSQRLPAARLSRAFC